MYTRTAHVTLKHTGKLYGLAQFLILRRRCLLYFRYTLQHIGQIGLAWLAIGGIGQTVRNSLAQVV